MKLRTVLLAGCAGMAVIGIVAVTSISLWFVHVTQDPEGLWLSADAPDRVALGESFSLIVSVANRDSQRSIALGDLDIADAYLSGFAIRSVSPDPRSTEIDTLNDCTTMRFDVTLSPGAEAEFRLELRAERLGRFRGQVDQYVGMQFLSTVVQTTVRGTSRQPATEALDKEVAVLAFAGCAAPQKPLETAYSSVFLEVSSATGEYYRLRYDGDRTLGLRFGQDVLYSTSDPFVSRGDSVEKN